MNLSSAYLLVFHGSRDRRSQSAVCDLKQLFAAKFQSKNILTQGNYIGTDLLFEQSKNISTLDYPTVPFVGTAALELASLSLSESLIKFAQTAAQKGYQSIRVLPLFLTPGVHVQTDVPQEVACAIKQINNKKLTIELLSYLGKYSGMVSLLSRKFAQLSGETRIFVSHGSRLPEVNCFSQNLANQLDAEIAYWSRSPGLKQQITKQLAAGKQSIVVLPYFLFPGKITTAIAQEVEQLQRANPQASIIIGQPLGATETLAQVIFEEVTGVNESG